jgi:integrase
MTEKKARKPRTRGNRDSKPYQRSSDGKWVAVAYMPNGKRKPCYGDTSKEAAEKRKKLYAELENQEPVTVGRSITLGRYLEKQWLGVTLPQRVAAGRIAQTTLDSYRDNTEKHIIPALGKVKLVDLKPAHLRPWLLDLQKKPSGRARTKLRPGETELPPPEVLSARTVAYCHAILRKALADAVDEELAKRNVALLVDPPVVDRKEATPPTKEEATKLLAAAAGDRLWAYWLIVLALGLRRGEGLGLRWDGIDTDAGTVRLEKSVQRLRGEKDPETGRRKGQLVEKSLKTEASKATMATPPIVMEALRVHKELQDAEREATKAWADAGLVFTSTVGSALEPRNVNRAWDEVCDRSGIGRRVRIHDLRHAAGSYLFAAGVDMKVVQKTLRHTRLATTSDIYVHTFMETQREAADSMEGVLVDLTKKREEREAG